MTWGYVAVTHALYRQSTVAAAAVRSINPAIKIRAMSHKVHEETEHLFDDRFWDRCGTTVKTPCMSPELQKIGAFDTVFIP